MAATAHARPWWAMCTASLRSGVPCGRSRTALPPPDRLACGLDDGGGAVRSVATSQRREAPAHIDDVSAVSRDSRPMVHRSTTPQTRAAGGSTKTPLRCPSRSGLARHAAPGRFRMCAAVTSTSTTSRSKPSPTSSSMTTFSRARVTRGTRRRRPAAGASMQNDDTA